MSFSVPCLSNHPFNESLLKKFHYLTHLPTLSLSVVTILFLYRPFLLESASKDVRHSFSEVLSVAVQSYLAFGSGTREGPVASIIDYLLVMLDKDVVDNCKSCCEYFEFFKNYASYVSQGRDLWAGKISSA